ncbi:MAG: hypothetical protein JO006_05135 [Paucibacter sp.]|nr:hypothetical protein [Roseateles sp.]
MKPLLFLLAFATLPALAAQEREQLRARQDVVERRFTEDSRECARHFVVNACLDEARERRRLALKPIVERQLALDAQERRERSSEQAERVRQRQQEAGASEASALSVPLRASEPRAAKPQAQPRVAPDAQKRASEQEARIDAAQRDAARNRAKLAARQAQLRERQQQAERDADNPRAKAANSLPTPTAAQIATLKASEAASR